MDYKNGKIYCIRSHKTDDIYIGSTSQPLHKRFYYHKRGYKCWKNGKGKYVTSYKLIDNYDDCYIELIEEFPCENKMQLNKREGELIRENYNVVNKKIAGRTDKEYREDNRDKMKQYKEDNKERLKQYNKEYYEKNRDKKRIEIRKEK